MNEDKAIPFEWFYAQIAKHPESFKTRIYDLVLKDYMKEQESGKVNVTITQSDGWKESNCHFCGMKVNSFYNWSFCGTCGRPVKWK